MSNWLGRLLSEDAPSRALGVFRAAVGVAAVVKTIDLGAKLRGIDHFESGSFEWLGSLPGTIWPLFLILWLSAATALTMGYRSRPAAAGVALLTAFFISFAGLYSNNFYFLGTLAALLVLADCGAAFSLDARAKGTRERITMWPVRLIQIQITLVYVYSAISKINEDFLPGNVLFYRADAATLLPSLDGISSFALFAGMSAGAILAELFIPMALWIARLRPAAFGLGLLLHTSMLVMISNTPQRALRLIIFALLSLSCYLLFVRAEPKSRVVVWDEHCSFCSVWVKWFRRLDWLRAFRFVGLEEANGYIDLGLERDGAPEALRLVEPDGRRHEGFEAVRRIAALLPLTFLLAPFLALRPVRVVGEWGYKRVAARRSCQGALRRLISSTTLSDPPP